MRSSSYFGEYKQNSRPVLDPKHSLDTSGSIYRLKFPKFAGLILILCGLTSASTFAAQRLTLPMQPLAFEPNQGQTGHDVAFLARGKGYTLYLRPSEAVLALKNPSSSTVSSKRPKALHLRLLGAATKASTEGQSPLPGRHNYYIGNDPARWKTNIPTFSRVVATSVYPGIDVVYYGKEGTLEYDFKVAAGADPRRIRLGFDGADKLKLNSKGDLLITAGKAQLVQYAPFAYQTISDKKVPVAARYVLRGNTVALDIGSYDRHKPLIIDPAFSYVSFLGGLGDDVANAVAVDANGNIFITGSTWSISFPGSTTNLTPSVPQNSDAFVTMLNKHGTVIFTTYLGSDGSNSLADFPEGGRGIAVKNGKIYVTGITDGGFTTIYFPTIGSQTPYESCGQVAANYVFVSILNKSDGSIYYSTCVGNGGTQAGTGIAVDNADDDVNVVGWTTSSLFPTTTTTRELQTSKDTSPLIRDSFFFKLDPTQGSNGLLYSTYLGSTLGNTASCCSTYANAVALDSNDIAYVAGWTGVTAGNFPTAFADKLATGKYPTYNGGTGDAFIYKINPAAAPPLLYATYLGGSGFEAASGIAVATPSTGDPDIYVTGQTTSSNFPNLNAFQSTLRGGSQYVGDAFVAKFSSAANSAYALSYSTYLGGSNEDEADGIAVDSATGRAYVAGGTTSSDFPVGSASHMQAVHAAVSAKDAFVTSLDASGNTLHYSTYLGGQVDDQAHGIAVAANDKAYVVGSTSSSPYFPVTSDAVQNANQSTQNGAYGLLDAFIARIAPVANLNLAIAALVGNDLTNTAPITGDKLTYTIVVANPQGPDPATGVNLTIDYSAPGTNASSTPFGSPPTPMETDVDNACVDGGFNTSTAGHQIFTCQWATLAVGASKTITIAGTLYTGSTLVADVTLSSNENDAKTTSYSITPGTTVPPPSTIVTGGTTPTPTQSGGGGGGGTLGPLMLLFLTFAALISFPRNRARRRS